MSPDVVILTWQYLAASAHACLISGVAGCQSAGPREDRRPIPRADALITPTSRSWLKQITGISKHGKHGFVPKYHCNCRDSKN